MKHVLMPENDLNFDIQQQGQVIITLSNATTATIRA